MSATEFWNVIFLGVVQGITEFLPISSSGHLVIFSELIHIRTGREVDPESNLQLIVALHFGTLISIAVVYWRDMLRTIRSPRMCGLIVVATLPVVALYLVVHDFLEQTTQTPLAAGIGLFVTAALLTVAHRANRGEREWETMSWKTAGVVGLFQAVAIVPGISRSGSTISAGLFLGLRRDEAARFSFLIAIPAIAGAVVLTGKDILAGEGGGNSLAVLLIGAVVSFVVGLLALRWLIRLVNQQRLHWFAWYCAAAGTLTVGWQLFVIFGE